MKIKLYVSWKDEEILTEKEYNERVNNCLIDKDEFNSYKADYLNEEIEEYIRNHPSYLSDYETVFNFTEEDKNKILDNLRKRYEEDVKLNFKEDYDEVEIEI